jgi:hypothetical protein
MCGLNIARVFGGFFLLLAWVDRSFLRRSLRCLRLQTKPRAPVVQLPPKELLVNPLLTAAAEHE